MATVEVTIADEVGLHARPAAKFVKLASGYDSQIRVTHGAKSANAKSLVEVLQLEAGQGALVTIQAEGDDADEALAALKERLAGS